MDTTLITQAEEYIRTVFAEDCSGHDHFHSLRVCRTAVALARQEGAELETVALAALLHDVDDKKLSPETCETKECAAGFLRSHGVPPERISEILRIIGEVSFKGTDSVVPSTVEGRCVQDADRLDAIGAIGIARTFAFGGSRHRAMYDPGIPPLTEMNEQQYFAHGSTTLNHFHEKLFLLADMMTTAAGRKMAARRDAYMHRFVEEFLAEWDGRDMELL